MKRLTAFALLILLATTTAGCDFVGDVLEFSLWLALIMIVVVALLIFAVYKSFFD